MAAPLALRAIPAHSLSVDTVVAELETDAETGLTRAEAARRLAADGPNEIIGQPPRTWLQRIGRQFVDPLVALLLVATAISLIAWWVEGTDGVPFDAVVITVIVMLNAAIGAVQEQRAEDAVAALQSMAAAQASVVRDAKFERIRAAEVVVGDVIVLDEGDAVAADARVLEDRVLVMSEASLTGESDTVRKTPEPVDAATALGDRTSMVYAGTTTSSGHGHAVVTATGMATEVGRIASLLDETERQPTPLEREISRVGRILGIAVIVIAFVVVGVTMSVSDVDSASELVDILLIGVALAVAAVPEGLPAVLSIVLAIGVQRMAARNALVKRLASAETLGSATVICTDKTGTLTRSEMTVRRLVTGDATLDITGTGYGPDGELRVGGHIAGGGALEQARETLLAGALASNATVRRQDGGWEAIGDPTEASIVAAAAKAGVGPGELESYQRIDYLPFTSDRKRMSVLVRVAGDGSPAGGARLITKGAPDLLLERCTHEQLGGVPVRLVDERRQWWDEQIRSLAGSAMRTLAIADRVHEPTDLDDDSESGLVLLGVVGIMDPPREESAPAVAAAHAAGIRVIMITGDHAATAGQIASDLRIAAAGDRVITGPELETFDDQDLLAAAADTNVFARVAPAHKLRLVEALQGQHEIVAMTGDGVNDAPALKAADIGTAMGVAGTDVAREAADMVLTDDNFATIIAAVAEGRGIFHNIRSFLRYLLSSNIGEVLTMLLGVMLAGVIDLDGGAGGVIAPLTAAQILWINLLTDTGPALALGVDPGAPRLMQRHPRSAGDRVIDAPMQFGIALVGLAMAISTLTMLDAKLPGGLIDGSADVETARTAAFTVLVLAQLFNCFSARSDSVTAFHNWAANRWLLVAVAASVGLQVLVVYLPVLNDAFGTAALSATDWIWCTALASTVLWVSEVRKLIRRSRGAAVAHRPGPFPLVPPARLPESRLVESRTIWREHNDADIERSGEHDART